MTESTVPFRVGFKGNDLWNAVLKGESKKVETLLKKGADITFMNDDKSIVTMVRELEMSHQNSGDAVKIQYFRHMKGLIETNLNASVLSGVDAADLDRLHALAKAGADFYQNGQVLPKAVGCPKDSFELVSFVLSANPGNDRYIEALQADGKTFAGYLLAIANSKNCKNAAAAVKNRLNFILVQDAEAGNLPRVQAHLKLGPELIDLKFKRGDGHTALMVAVRNKRVEVTRVLLEHGANVMDKNAQNKTARDLCNNDVRISAMLDKIMMANELREKIEKTGPSLSTEVIGEYLDKGVQVNSTDADGNTVLSLAVRYKCSAEVLADLVATYHADPNIRNRRGIGPVEMALVYRDDVVLLSLFRAGVNIKRVRNTLLKYAEINGFAGSVQLIKEELGNLLWKSVDNENVTEIKEMLTNCGTYVDETSKMEGYEGWTTLFLAAHKNNVEVVKLLCQSQADVDKRCDDGKTAISIAVQTDRKEVLLYLISEGASVNIEDQHGNTPLSIAIKGCHLPLVQILLLAGANPYHEQGGVKVAEMGLGAADKNIVYIFEQLDFSTAIPDWDEENAPKQRPLLKYSFCRAPFSFNTSPPPEQTLVLQGKEKTNKKLLDAAKTGRSNQVKEAIAEGADIRFCDNKMKTSLHHVQERLVRLQREPESPIQEKRSFQISQTNYYKDILLFLNTKLNEYIWNAVKGETLERVQTIHKCGAPLNWCTRELPLGLPGLLAISQDTPDIMSYLVYYCPENVQALRMKDLQGETVLSLAEKKGFKNLATWVRAKMTHQLSLAMANKDLAASKHILRLGAAPELTRPDGETHLHKAVVEFRDLELVQMLIKAGDDAATKYQGKSLIDLADKKDKKISRFLSTVLFTQKLHLATSQGDLAVVKEHHLAGGRISSESYAGITPLRCAIDIGNTKLIHYLISRGASLVRSATSIDPIGQLKNLNYNPPLKSYIQRSVDEQFLTSIIEGNLNKLDNLLQLGANIAYSNPNSQETATSLCIDYHSVDLLKFLENRGAVLTSPADAKGNYALGIAAARGNTAVVEYLLHEININKSIRNNEGKTPLDIAQETDHQEVVRLLGGEVKEDKGKKAYNPPKYKQEELLDAVKKCNMIIIKEFIEETYSRRDEKVYHCVEMWKVSQNENQKEVEKKLAEHYRELIEDTSEHKLTGSAESQVILTGFLRSLSSQITGYALDPNDPRSYDSFFKNMDLKAQEARKRILIDDLQELKAQFQEDLGKVQEEINGLQKQREQMESRDREYFEQIAQMKAQLVEEKSARERDRIRQEMIKLQDDVKTLQAERKILEDQQKRQMLHSEVSKRFEATHINLLLFYRTIFLGVEEIFLGAKAVSSGMAVATAGSLGKKAHKIEAVSDGILTVFKLVPLVGDPVVGITKAIIKTGTTSMRSLDKYRQKEIAQYISCLATIGEQSDICTNVAYKLTLWYSDQIQRLAEPSDSSKTSVCLHAPARRMAQLAVGIMYTSLCDNLLEKDKSGELSSLVDKFVWCVVTRKPGDGIISKLQQYAWDAAAKLKKKVGKGPTGTGFMGSKVPPNFIEIELDPAYHKESQKTWMLRDIFHKCGIIDKEGNLYEGPDSDTLVYLYCYGTETAAHERGLEKKSEKKTAPKNDMFVEEDVLVVSSVGGSSSGAKFHLAPGKIDERVQSILEKENLNRDDMEKSWKEDIRELQDEAFVRIDNLEEERSSLKAELRDKVLKIEEIAEEKTKLYEATLNRYQGELLGKYNELKNKMEQNFNSVFKKMQAETKKQFEDMQQKFSKKEQELDAAFQKNQAKLDEQYSETERRLEAQTTAKIKEMEAKSKQFCETLRKETLANFKFSKEQMDQFLDDQIKQIKKIQAENAAKLEAQTLSYKKDSDKTTGMARQELINIMESRTTRHHKEIKEECENNMKEMAEMVAKLENRLKTLEETVSSSW